MNAREVLAELKKMGSESIKKVLRNHGVQEPFFGVKIGDMKKIQKRIRKDYRLALDLYDTGNYDAMYLAGLIADETQMTRPDLDGWVKKAKGGGLNSATVPWVAAESPHGREAALEWIDSDEEHIAVAGWCTLGSLVAIKNDGDLDLAELKKLLQRVVKTIHRQPNFVRYAMNTFVIALGVHVQPLADAALAAGEKIGKVAVDMGNTACEVPFAPERIRKAQDGGTAGKKRKTARC